ncbi:Putative ribonuclease H protein At1g65750 [Linum perenne]
MSQMPIYYLSLFKAHVAVVKELEKMQNRFLWEGCGEERRPHLVRWDVVKVQKERGGLGVLDLRRMNMALLGKWGWRFATEINSWWRNLIVEKCGRGRSEWKPIWDLRNAGWSVWRDIVNLNPKFWKYAVIDPGGGGVSFWFDSWVLGVCLADRFPRVAAVASSRDVSLSSSVLIGDRYIWSVPLTTVLRGGAEEERPRMMATLEEVPFGWISQGPPTPVWSLTSSGVFTVESFSRALHQQVAGGVDDFPFRTVWIGQVPTKISGFLW